MSKLSTPTAKEVALARKAGYKGKRPARPRKNSTLAAIESYLVRHNTWCTKIRAAAAAELKRQLLVKTIYK